MKIKNVCNYLDVISTLKKFYGEKLEYGGKNEVVYAEFYFRGISNKEWSLIPRALNEKICVLTNDLYDEPLEIFKKEAIAVLVTAPYLEELILLSSKVYVKHESGLNQVDLSEEKGNDEPTYSANLQPNVFKILCKIDDKMIFFSPT